MSAFAGEGSSSDGHTVFIGNLSYETIQGDIDVLFEGLRVQRIRLVHDRDTGAMRGFGYVEFEDEDSMRQALERDGQIILGRPVRVNVAPQKGQGGAGHGGRGGRGGNRGGYNNYNDNSTRQTRDGDNANFDRPIPDEPPFTAFVGNLTFDCVSSDLEHLFEGLDISDIRLMSDRETGRSKGFAYVEFANKQSLADALGFNGQNWNGRDLRINVVDQKGSRRGGRGGFSKGGDFGGSSNRGGLFSSGRSLRSNDGQRNSERGGFGSFSRNRHANEEAANDQRRGSVDIKEPTAEDEAERPRLKLKGRTRPME